MTYGTFTRRQNTMDQMTCKIKISEEVSTFVSYGGLGMDTLQVNRVGTDTL